MEQIFKKLDSIMECHTAGQRETVIAEVKALLLAHPSQNVAPFPFEVVTATRLSDWAVTKEQITGGYLASETADESTIRANMAENKALGYGSAAGTLNADPNAVLDDDGGPPPLPNVKE